MRNALLATASLAFVSSPALAADKMSVGVGGYMQQWFGMSSVDDTGKFDDKGKLVEEISDGTAQQSDSEIFFKGSLEADNGLTFSVKVELEGNNSDGATAIDESQLTVGGSFGKVTLGAEDPASTLMHYGGLDVGVSLNCGDTHKWIGGLAGCSHNGFGTYGHGHGDKNQITYFTPRMNGVQLGATYIPDRTQEGGNNALNDNETDGWAVGANYAGDLGEDLSVSLSLGHYQGSQTGEAQDIFDGMMPGAKDGDPRVTGGYTATQNDADKAAKKALADAVAGMTASDGNDATDDFTVLQDAAKAANDRLDAYTVSQMVKADDKTFQNVGLQVGMGGFTFTVAYAANDGGAYKVAKADRLMTASEFDAGKAADLLPSTATYVVGTGIVTDTAVTVAISDTTGLPVPKTADGSAPSGATLRPETATATVDHDNDDTTPAIQVNDTSNDNPMLRLDKIVEDKSMNWDTWGASVKYSEGAMAVSLSHLATEWDDGGEQEGTMLSVSYTLAPGVASKSSIFTAERSFANGRDIEGTGFVTGITVGF